MKMTDIPLTVRKIIGAIVIIASINIAIKVICYLWYAFVWLICVARDIMEATI